MWHVKKKVKKLKWKFKLVNSEIKQMTFMWRETAHHRKLLHLRGFLLQFQESLPLVVNGPWIFEV